MSDTVRDYSERSGRNKTPNGGSAFPANDNFRSQNDVLIKNIDALQLPREIDTSLSVISDSSRKSRKSNKSSFLRLPDIFRDGNGNVKRKKKKGKANLKYLNPAFFRL